MPRKFRNLSISILKPSPSQDFTFDCSFDQPAQYAAPPMSAPPTTLSMPKDLFILNEACESCDACTALAGQRCRNAHHDGPPSTNGLGSASSTRRKMMLDSSSNNNSSSSSNNGGGGGSPTLRSFEAQRRYRRHPTILPTRHRGRACRVPNSTPERDMYDARRSSSLSNESSPATTPTDERSSTGLDSPLRSLSLGSLSLGSASTLDLSACSSPRSPAPKFRFIDRSFF